MKYQHLNMVERGTYRKASIQKPKFRGWFLIIITLYLVNIWACASQPAQINIKGAGYDTCVEPLYLSNSKLDSLIYINQ